jgi:hypothetical protein
VVSGVCEAFGVPPREAVRVILEDPEHLAIPIMELRGFAEAKRRWEQAKKEKDALKLRGDPMIERVIEIEMEQAGNRKRRA